MKLINWGAGEASDRLTILSLKILIGTERGVDIAHFRNEKTALITKLGTQSLNGSWFAQVLELAAVNAALWHAEDDLREMRNMREGQRAQWTGSQPGDQTWVEQVAGVGIRIQSLNDQRALLVQAINEKTGEAIGSEKLT